MKIIVTSGAAIVRNGGLRCNAPRIGDPDRTCNKLLVKLNSVGQVAGAFMCDRCRRIAVVELVQES